MTNDEQRMPEASEIDMKVATTFDLAQLPLILAGPILRRTEPQSVSVWIVLQAAAAIQLQVLPAAGDTIDATHPLLQGTATTIAIGKSLHVALITAQPISGECLTPNQLYAYDLKIYPRQSTTTISLQQALRSPIFPDVCISYFAHGLPTFALSPNDLNDLRILHGSCRKLHDHELDALPIIDQMIAETANQPNVRPHQLFFTGDQIYGDEVADAFLWGIHQLQPILFGWEETLLDQIPEVHHHQLKPGKRKALAESHAGLTASLQGDEHKTQSHLLRFSEYCTSYLFAWSECFWHFRFPPASEVGRSGKAAKKWNQEVQHLQATARSQMTVRRALANIPTYMIFDDHDVSDDWNLNQAWCLRVLGKPLGRQVVRNALLSYALFQGWGNSPEQFFPDTIGSDLLAATGSWCRSAGEDESAVSTIQEALGMPPVDPVTDLPEFQADGDVWILSRPKKSLTWHYRVQGTAHEVLVLDTRTQRGYPIDQAVDALPHLLSPSAFRQQLQSMLKAKDATASSTSEATTRITFIVAPTNVFTLEILDHIQRFGQFFNKTYKMDIGDSWNLESTTRLRLMREMFRDRQQVIILSGDIHFGAALRVDYWHQPHDTAITFSRSEEAPNACLVQLVASAIGNSELLTEVLQTKIKLPFSERMRYWIGYADEHQEIEVTPHFWQSIARSITRLTNPQAQRQSRRLINWGYRSRWLHREPARQPTWQHPPEWLQSLPRNDHKLGVLRQIWRWRWLQEGKEVVGSNNIGLVQLSWPRSPAQSPDYRSEATPMVIYDLYWYAPWRFPHVVYSRFKTALRPTQ
jgi:hypothetical protein